MSAPLSDGLRAKLRQISTSSQRSFEELCAEAASDLDELASVRGKLGSWLFASLSRFVWRRGYRGEPIYDRAELAKVRQAMQSGSLVFLISHKTYLDFFVLFDFFYRLGMAPPRIFGGANMAFAGFGALARHAGGIFIRRSFRDDEVYKAALSQCIADLVVQGESFMWAIEGTRSRTGKLLIPKLGLLHYVSEAARPLGDDVVSFLPVAVVYDRIPDVADMAAQEAGAGKQSESLAWFFGYLRKLRGRHGDIHVRFASPIALGDTPDAPDLGVSSSELSTEEQQAQIAVQKLAFETCFRINEVTPATMTSLVLLSLLCRGNASDGDIENDVQVLQAYIGERHPAAQGLQPSRPGSESPAECMQALVNAGLLQARQGASGREMQIRPQTLSQAIYYSNMAAHHFVTPAFAELALAQLSQRGENAGLADFEARCMALRELFKFEFFFSRKEIFLQQLNDELAYLGLRNSGQQLFEPDAIMQSLASQTVRVAIGVLAPYLAAYRAIAERLAHDDQSAALSDKELIASCLNSAQAPPDGKADIFRPGLSRALLASGIRVADSRGLRMARQLDELRSDRQALIDELDEIESSLRKLAELNLVSQ